MLKSFFHPTLIEAGVDEVGRGSLAGPVVAAAVILPKNYTNSLLNDSKLLSAKKRFHLKNEILDIALAWAIAEVSNQEIDLINILNATFKAMHTAIDRLPIRPEHLLIDGNRFINYPSIPHTCIIKGDSNYLSIAAASVLAKTYRDALMMELSKEYPQYGWERNMGYGTFEHLSVIRAHGLSIYHRTTYKH
jgi:ribonuclease HII